MNTCPSKLSLALCALALGACADSKPRAPIYEDVTELSGLQFAHQNGSEDSLALPAILGSGVALFDVDNDADLDIYLVQGRAGADSPDEIWLNDSQNGRLRFSRLADQAVFASGSPGTGVAISDVNLDGRLDVMVTTVGVNRLLLNTGSGFMASTSDVLGADDVWSSSAVWLDANVDGLPDLYISNVAQFDANILCRSNTSRPDYCGADAFVPLHDQLLLNFGATDTGDVVFEDVSHDWNLASVKAPSLGVRVGDFNNDDWPDVFVATLGMDNALWINEGGREFDERARSSGVSSSFLGRHHGSVGVDAADLDRDYDLDLVVSHHRGEPHQVYANDGSGNFIASDLVAGGASEADSGAGLVILDANTNGRDDVFVANGAVHQRQAQLDASDALPLRESNTLFLQREVGDASVGDSNELGVMSSGSSTGDLSVVAAATPPAHDEVNMPEPDATINFQVWEQTAERLTPKPQVSRSVATGDLDNDGDLDLVITNNGGPAQVLRSTMDPDNWIGIDPVSNVTGMTVVGTRAQLIEPKTPGTREVRRSHGYLSASDPRLIFYGVPDDADHVTLELKWPNGARERFVVPAEARYHRLVRGQGET